MPCTGGTQAGGLVGRLQARGGVRGAEGALHGSPLAKKSQQRVACVLCCYRVEMYGDSQGHCIAGSLANK